MQHSSAYASLEIALSVPRAEEAARTEVQNQARDASAAPAKACAAPAKACSRGLAVVLRLRRESSRPRTSSTHSMDRSPVNARR